MVQSNGAVSAIGIRDSYRVRSVPNAIRTPHLLLYLNGEPDDADTLRVIVYGPSGVLAFDPLQGEVRMDGRRSIVEALPLTGDDHRTLQLEETGTYTVAVTLGDRLNVAFHFEVETEPEEEGQIRESATPAWQAREAARGLLGGPGGRMA